MDSLYVRTSSNGYVRDIFLDIVQTFIDLELTDVIKEKLVGFCSDGAAHMMGYKLFLYQLENASHQNAKAEGLAKMMRDGILILYMLSLKRVISNLQSLSLYLQTDLISLADAARRVESSKTAISQLCEKDDSTVSEVSTSETYKQEKLVFRGVKAKADQRSLIKEIVENLEARFPTSDLVSATMVSSFKNWPDLTSDEIKGNLVRASPYKMCWTNGQHWETDLPQCDTSFSAMKLLKNKRRGRLRAGRLNDVMMVKLRLNSDFEDDDEYDEDDDDGDEDMELSAEHAFADVIKND
ncbi:hypothetical protein DPMN_096044 [Dreissena polymorpha]|uniref:Uncharacterized protein n=1 Tax=Dreissena polymorpha TaxID=45954 RepID=A0A9D4L967_DREPO|nr:hypothetical protein DPMN_096044 [Dreissena polymorpha]